VSTEKKRTHQHDKLAELYDAQILPLWSQRFGKMMLRDLSLPPKAMVLDVGCGTGYPALEILRKMDDQGRIIAIDASSSMLDQARAKAGPLSGKRIYFRSESAVPKLSFADDVYDLVVCNAGLQEFEDPEAAIRDFARVTKPGGRVIVTMPLAGTFTEFYDIFREVLTKNDRQDAIDRLDAYLTRYPPIEQAQAWLEDAGLHDVKSEFDQFTLLFKSGREFFFTPIIEYGPLSDWKTIAGKGKEMQDAFWNAKAAIDSYFKGSSFAVSVVAGCLRGTKATAEAGRLLLDKEGDETPTGELSLVTSEIEIVDGIGTGRRELEIDEDDIAEDLEDDDKEPIL
jgi:ubiquinone/menaquinone biosynthesis C-methylase UbiE